MMIKKYIHKLKNKIYINRWTENLKIKIFNEIHDEYINWEDRKISFFDGDHIILKDKQPITTSKFGSSRIIGECYYSDKIPLIEIISDDLISEIKNYKRLIKLNNII